MGVAVYSQPWAHVVAALLGEAVGSDQNEVLELGRLVLRDEVPANGESWFVSQTFRLLRNEGYPAVISMSDPEARVGEGGEIVFPGHIGVVYQALNASYLGRGKRRRLRLLPDGTVFSERVVQKIRHRERGWHYGVERLVRLGASEPGADLEGWLRHWLPELTRPMEHGGNHRYGWLLDSRSHARRLLSVSQPYPKWEG